MRNVRIKDKGLIDRGKTIKFLFDGRTYEGNPGDTLASALLANGVRIIGRSFKYHRPRGFWGAWSDDPNGIFDIKCGSLHLPNCQATTTYLEEGMELRSVNAYPSAQFDLKSGLDLFNRFMPAGFYYKTFMWPNWHLFEPAIRKMAGLGRVSTKIDDNYQSDQIHTQCDLLVVGGGAAGLSAARTAAEAGQNVLLVDDQLHLGGGLFGLNQEVDGKTPPQWINEHRRAIEKTGARILTQTSAIGVHDHNLVSLCENRGFKNAPRLWRVRAKRILLATGAIERTLQFANNDRPGVMAASAALEFLGRYGVLVSNKIAILSNNALTEKSAQQFQDAGAHVTILDGTIGQARAKGRKYLRSIGINDTNVPCDTLLVSGGWTPTVHLWRHAGGKLDWSKELDAFLPRPGLENVSIVGAASGVYDLETSINQAALVAGGGQSSPPATCFEIKQNWPKPDSFGRKWVDLQSDVTVKDIELAAHEGYQSVEHLKRYTTLGMATDQGKTSNMSGLLSLASILQKLVPEVGTTTFRPPYVPVPLEIFSAHRRGTLVNPIKRLVLETEHRNLSAALGEYGGSLRPGWYGSGDPVKIARHEAVTARNFGGIFDASPLGKIEVIGPDAADFVNFIYYNTISTLRSGRIRYGFMLHENGTIMDDGVIARISEDRFIISCSSSHVDAVNNWLENWRQDSYDTSRVFIHDTTTNWATIAISGPFAREVLAQLNVGIELSADTFPHMALQIGTFQGLEARIARVSFTGDLSYEISVPNKNAKPLWRAVCAIGAPLGVVPIGVEALSILRAEKGYIIIGKDTDGETMPHDLGFSVPRNKKKVPYVGDRSLHTEYANSDTRLQLVGLAVEEGQPALPTGAHLIEYSASKPKSIGYVTSSYVSPILNRPIALGLVQAGQSRAGETVQVWHLGKQLKAIINTPGFYDQEGVILNA